ncbi:tRNA-histidine guanylyltransferase 1-like, partial [Coemansia sp. RSA 922]
ETHNTNSFQQALLFDSTHSSDSETAADVGSDGPVEQIKITAQPSLLPPLDDDTDVEAKLSLDRKALLTRSESENVAMYLSRVRLSSDSTRTAAEPTVATCLQSGSICPSALELARAHPVVPVSVSEAMAVEACRRLLDDHQLLIEIGSAAALSIVGKRLVHQIIPDLGSDDHVVVIVTGGANISFDRLDSCRQRFPYPAPIIAKSGHEIFMRMSDSALSVAGSTQNSSSMCSASPASLLLKHMAKSKYTYVRDFEREERLLPNTWLVVRIDGQGFTGFTTKHGFTKPNDIRALHLMNRAAKVVMESMVEIVLAYGESDEYSFVFPKKAKAYDRRASKLITLLVSKFTAAYVFYWNEFFPDTPLQFPPAFDGRVVVYPSDRIMRDYLCWRQADCHINNMYNTCFWLLVNQGGMSQRDAEKRLNGTLSRDKHELLFSEFGVNYNHEQEIFKKGSVLLREQVPIDVADKDGNSIQRQKKVVQIQHCDIIGDAFWREHLEILGEQA